MRSVSLFSGCGGLDLGIHAAFGVEPSVLCESDKHCRTILERHYPGVPIIHDVREIDESLGHVDVLHGGYPCQPFSHAGKRGGESDPRHLWPEFARCVRVLRPRLVVLENVSGHLSLGFDVVLSDLAEAGFDAEWVVARASDVGAPHGRARLFVVAYPSGDEGWFAIGDGGVASDSEHDGRDESSVGRGSSKSETGWGLLELEGCVATVVADTCGERRQGHNDGRSREVGSCAPGCSSFASDVPGERDQDEPQVDGRESAVAGTVSRTGDRVITGCSAARVQELGRSSGMEWGVYEPAIRQWESALGRQAPRPTDDRGRLEPRFVEWMMGLPDCWTEGVARTHRLRMLGNAVVPQQAAYALGVLLNSLVRGVAS